MVSKLYTEAHARLKLEVLRIYSLLKVLLQCISSIISNLQFILEAPTLSSNARFPDPLERSTSTLYIMFLAFLDLFFPKALTGSNFGFFSHIALLYMLSHF